MQINTIKPLVVLLLLTINSAQSQQNVSVIIIGAGSSGIAAATRLLKNNFTNVQVLEAEERIGGRIHSVHFGDAFVDLGAEFCHGEGGNVVYSLAKDLKLLMSPKPEYELYYSDSGDEVGIDVSDSLFELAHSIQHRKEVNESSECDICGSIVSEGECLEVNFLKLLNCSRDDIRPMLELAYDWLRSYKSCTESCTDLNDVSLVSNYQECQGDQMLQWCGHGFKSILEIMMQKHPEQLGVDPLDVVIKLNKTVTKIVLHQEQVSVRTKDGDEFWADHVIFTPSLGVLKERHRDLFSPALSADKLQAIDRIGYGVIVKVALYFDYMWWLIHGPRIWGCIWSPQHNEELQAENLFWVRHFTAFTAAPRNLKVLIAWFAGESTPEIENLTDHELLRGIRFILSKCYFRYMGIDMPKKVLRSYWLTNPNFKGTYSYDSLRGFGDPDLRDKLASAVLSEEGVPRIMFAGEATHATMFATVHGAIESGYREADRLIELYGNDE